MFATSYLIFVRSQLLQVLTWYILEMTPPSHQLLWYNICRIEWCNGVSLCLYKRIPILRKDYSNTRPWLEIGTASRIPLFQQVTWFHIIAFYTPILIHNIGLGENSFLLSALVIGPAIVTLLLSWWLSLIKLANHVHDGGHSNAHLNGNGWNRKGGQLCSDNETSKGYMRYWPYFDLYGLMGFVLIVLFTYVPTHKRIVNWWSNWTRTIREEKKMNF